MKGITTVTRTDIDADVTELPGARGDLTDVYVEKLLASKLTHTRMLALPRRVDRLVRVLHEPLCPTDRARDIEALVEVAEVLRGLESFFECGLRETQGRSEPLELARIDIPHPRIIALRRTPAARHHAHRGIARAVSSFSLDALRSIRRVSQIRQFTDEPVPDTVIDALLELARWTGSAKNSQPWHFVVVRDRETLRRISALRPSINWAAAAPVAIAIVLDGAEPMFGAYDEGRVTERLLTGATMLGYGGGVAWFGGPEHDSEAKRILGIPGSLTARQVVTIGRPKSRNDPRPTGPSRGRKPLGDLVSYDRFGNKKR